MRIPPKVLEHFKCVGAACLFTFNKLFSVHLFIIISGKLYITGFSEIP